MIAGKTVLAIIPARGGSKGVPRKNIIQLAGKPLIAWTIEEAKKSRYIDRLILSSDDEEIIGVARAWGCEVPFVRPAELSLDDTPGIAPVLHTLEAISGFNYVVLLQPTSPLREAEDIDGCLELCDASAAPACVSVTEPSHHPHWTFSLDADNRLHPLFEAYAGRRQNLPRVYAINGAVYAAAVPQLLRARDFMMPATVAFVMPEHRSIDIDTQNDLALADCLLNGKKASHVQNH
ncbi:N-acylneuraminate cytidylyltransferase [mine drainage metagenome]|uniref:N-acylneuraminate cytidylyltransferase n=1 Tax=mine drainage metagenome TaxID=410659 RepID=A0A1J5SFQ0_9ZZZZ